METQGAARASPSFDFNNSRYSMQYTLKGTTHPAAVSTAH